MFRKIIIILLICFTCTQVGLAQSPAWVVNEGAFQQTETMICKLSINGVYLESPNDMVAAFVGNECRGVSKPVYIASVNKYLTYLTVFANNQGDTVTFKLYNSKTGQVVNAVNKLVFNINAQIGSTFQTYRISSTVLSSEAKLLSFGFSNTTTDSVKVETDLATGIKTNVYYIPLTASKTTLRPVFTVSPMANVFVLETPVVSGANTYDFTTNKTFQVLSEDESTLTNYIVAVKNSFSCADSVKFAPIITKDAASGYLISSKDSGNIWYKDGVLLKDTSKYYKPLANGSYAVKAPFATCMSALSFPYYFLLTDVVNIDNKQFIKVAPNPFNQQFKVDFNLSNYQRVNLKLVSLSTGNIVYKQDNVYAGTAIQPFNILSGVYICNIYSSDEKINYNFKLIKL